MMRMSSHKSLLERVPKSPIPYVPGRKLTVQSHIPPIPTQESYGRRMNTKSDIEKYKKLGPVDWAAEYPPRGGKLGSYSVDLEIFNGIQTGEDRGYSAQVFTVLIKGATGGAPNDPFRTDTSRQLLAKVYDPFYLNDSCGQRNAFRTTDHNYAHETAAYERLAEHQGTMIPKFYGGFSLVLPFVEGFRTVRLILIEYIDGYSMSVSKAYCFNQATRKQMMRSIVDFECAMYAKDMHLMCGPFPRNMIIRSDNQRIVAVDLERTVFTADDADYELYERSEHHIESWARCSLMPINWYKFCDRHDAFYSWIDWDWRVWLHDEWPHAYSRRNSPLPEKSPIPEK